MPVLLKILWHCILTSMFVGSLEYDEWLNHIHAWKLESAAIVESSCNFITCSHSPGKKRFSSFSPLPSFNTCWNLLLLVLMPFVLFYLDQDGLSSIELTYITYGGRHNQHITSIVAMKIYHLQNIQFILWMTF
jgi:hypothetical protein